MICKVFCFLLQTIITVIRENIIIILDELFYIVKELDCDTRVNVYVGITGLVVAIVVFVAEIISKEKVEIWKKLLLEKTGIHKCIAKMIFALFIIWISELTDPEKNRNLYIVVQIIVNIIIVYSMIDVFKVFKKIIKLNTDKRYINNEFEKFIYEKVEKNIKHIEKNKNKNKIRKQNEKFMDFIKQSKIFEYKPSILTIDDSFNILESNQYGYIYSYNYYMLNKIEKNLTNNNKSIINKDFSTKNNKEIISKIYICKKIGDKCNKGFAVAYYKNIDKDLVNYINKAITIDTHNRIDFDDEISKIIDDTFFLTFKNPFNKDEEDLLLNLYDFLCKNEYKNILSTYFEKIYYMCRDFSKNEKNNEYFTNFLAKLMERSFTNNQYEDFNKINKYITFLYINRMNFQNADLKYIAYRYANDVFIFTKYSIKIKKDYRYYDTIMSGLLRMIEEYLKRHTIDPILVLFDNINFEEKDYYDIEHFNDFEIVNFQFVIAIIYFLLNIYNLKEGKRNIVEGSSKIIDIIHYKLWKLYDLWDTIKLFNDYSTRKSEIKELIENADFDSTSHKYKNSWSWNPININEALKSIIYMFRIDYLNLDQIKEDEIKREDKFKYENLLKIFQSNSFEEFANKYMYKEKYQENAEKLLSKIIEIANKKQEEYEQNAELDEEVINNFKEIVIKNSKIKYEIEDVLMEIGHIKNSQDKLDIVFGISELLPRNLFIKDEFNMVYIDGLAADYGKALSKGITNEIMEYISNNCQEKEEKLEKMINNINVDDYILIANKAELRNYNYQYNEKYLEINKKKIRVLSSFDIETFILINKAAFPILELCEFSSNYNINNISDGIYCEIKDCMINESLRNDIIAGNSWLREKGNLKEQDDYLKTKCDFKVLKSYRIIDSDNKEIYYIRNN